MSKMPSYTFMSYFNVVSVFAFDHVVSKVVHVDFSSIRDRSDLISSNLIGSL